MKKHSSNQVLSILSKPAIVLLLVMGLYFLGAALLSSVTSLLYNETLPLPSLNRLLAGRDLHPLSHYLSYFLYLYRMVFLLLAGFVAYFAITRPTAFSRRFPHLAIFFEAILMALLSIFVFSQRIPLEVGLYDEGLILTGAWQFSLGAIPYRDFYNIYGPGQVAILGILFSLFGKSIFVAHLYDLLIRVAITLVVWGILRPLVHPMLRLFAHVATICWLYYFGLTLYPVYPALFFQLATIFVLLLPSTRPSSFPRYFCAGLLAGFSILFRHDIGTLFALLIFALLWVPLIAPVVPTSQPRPPVIFALGVILPPALVYGVFTFLVPIPVLWRQLVQMPLFVFPAYRSIPYPTPSHLLSSPGETAPFYMFPLIFLTFTGLSLFQTFRTRTLPPPRRAVFFLATLAAAGIPQALGRSDIAHLLPFSLPLVPLFFLSFSQSKRLIPLVVIFLCWSAFYVYRPIVKRIIVPLYGDSIPPDIGPLKEVICQSPPGPIFVGNRFHDSLSVNHPGLYFLLDRLPATLYFSYEPGEITTAPVQSEIVCELEEKSVQTLVLWDESPVTEPNRAAEDSHARVLDPYIQGHYHRTVDIPPYSIWSRLPQN